MNEVVKVKGVPVELDGRTYIVPPLTLGALEQLQGDIAKVQNPENQTEYVGVLVKVALAALKRNYPDMTRESLLAIVDLATMNTLFEAVMGVSGLERTDRVPSAEGN